MKIDIATSLPLFLLLLLQQSNLGRAELGHNEPCSIGASPSSNASAPQCNFTMGLICTDHNGHPVCRCVDDAQMEYNKEEATCQVFLNGKREWSNPIQPDHHTFLPCRDPYWSHYPDSSHCECWYDFSPEIGDTKLISPDNRCLPASAGASGYWCDDSTLPCHPKSGLICSNGGCKCPHPRKQYPVGEMDLAQKCLSHPEVEDGCENKSDLDCIPNAYCGEDNKCHCKPGFIRGGVLEHYRTGCFVDYQGNCSNDKNGQTELFCNQAAYLDCYDGKCGCMGGHDLVYDEITHRCTTTEGHVCNFHYEPGSTMIECGSGLECQALSPDKSVNTGICVKAKKNGRG